MKLNDCLIPNLFYFMYNIYFIFSIEDLSSTLNNHNFLNITIYLMFHFYHQISTHIFISKSAVQTMFKWKKNRIKTFSEKKNCLFPPHNKQLYEIHKKISCLYGMLNKHFSFFKFHNYMNQI